MRRSTRWRCRNLSERSPRTGRGARRYTCRVPARTPTNATRLPSGETATVRFDVNNSTPVGSVSPNRLTARRYRGAAACPDTTKAARPTAIAATAHGRKRVHDDDGTTSTSARSDEGPVIASVDLDARVGDVMEAPIGILFETSSKEPADRLQGPAAAARSTQALSSESPRPRPTPSHRSRTPCGRSASRRGRSRTTRYRCADRRLAAGLFGAHVASGAENQTSRRGLHGERRRHRQRRPSRGLGIRHLRQTEVEDFDLAARRDLDVRGLQVTMDDVLVVSGVERVGDLLRDRQCLVERQRAMDDPICAASALRPVRARCRSQPPIPRSRRPPRCWDD